MARRDGRLTLQVQIGQLASLSAIQYILLPRRAALHDTVFHRSAMNTSVHQAVGSVNSTGASRLPRAAAKPIAFPARGW